MNKLKRLTSIILAIILVVGLAQISVPAKAANEITYSFSGPDTALFGGFAEFTLKATGMNTVANGVTGYSGKFTYPASDFTIHNVRPLLTTSDFAYSINQSVSGVISFAFVSKQPITLASQDILKIEVEVIGQTEKIVSLGGTWNGSRPSDSGAPSYSGSKTAAFADVSAVGSPFPINIVENLGKLPTPTADKADGITLEYGELVTLSCSDPEATVYYTTNGDDPEIMGRRYDNPLSITYPCTLKAFAARLYYGHSDVAEFTYDVKLPLPTANPASGAINYGDTVELATIAGATIYYTTDGSTPTASSAEYTAPIVMETNTLKAIAVYTDYVDSAVVEFTYETKLPKPAASPASGTQLPVAGGDITLSSTITGAEIYYTVDGSDPAASGTLYTNPVNLTADTTIKAIAVKSGATSSDVAEFIYSTEMPGASTPVADPIAGTYTSAQQVTLSTTTQGAEIRYTLDGSAPTVTSTLYTGPISVSQSVTIKAVAIAAGHQDSAVETFSYTINIPVPAAMPTATPGAGTYTSPQGVALSTTTPGAEIRYTLDGSTPTASSALYTGVITVSQTTTIKAIAVALGYENSQVASFAYTISTTQPTAAAPTANPAAGTYTSAQSVALSTTTQGADIRYTLDGSTPTANSTLYAGPINVSQSTTIKAIAVVAGYQNSQVASFAYVINIQLPVAAAPVATPGSGTYTENKSVALISMTSGAKIYYTTTGATPTTSSTLYAGQPVVVDRTMTLKAIAVANGYQNSPVASFDYTINKAGALDIATPTITEVAGQNNPKKVTFACATAGVDMYYTTDGTTPNKDNGTKYTAGAEVSIAQTCVVKVIAVKTDYNDSAVAEKLVEVGGITWEKTANPTATPAAGTYTSNQNVALASATTGAKIYYTTNGNAPTIDSTEYTAPITVSSSQTIKAIAVAPQHTASDVASFAYVIDKAGPGPGPGPGPSTPVPEKPVEPEIEEPEIVEPEIKEPEYNFKENALEIGYVAGYPNNTFRPDGTVTRGEAVTMLGRLMDFIGYENVDISFDDDDMWAQEAIRAFAKAGLVNGVTPGHFEPDSNISRAQIATIICRMLKLDITNAPSADFPDANGHWAAAYINAIVQGGYMKGISADEFAPDKPLTRAELVTLINRVIGADVSSVVVEEEKFNDVTPEHWAYKDIYFAAK